MNKNKLIITILLLIVCIFVNYEIVDADFENYIEELEDKFNNFFEREKQDNQEYLNQVLNLADDLINEYPENPEVYDAVLVVYIRLDEYHESPLNILEKGKDYAKKFQEIAPERGSSYFWMAAFDGEIAQEKGILNSLFSVRPMRDNLEKAIELDPNFAPAYDVLAQLYLKAPGWPISIGNNRKALEYRKKSVELDPYNYEYQWYLYENYQKLNRDEEAEEVLETILEIPKEEKSEFYYGENLREEKKNKAQQKLGKNE